MKFGFVTKHRGAWTVRQLAIGVSRSGYKGWLTRPRCQREHDDQATDREVLQDVGKVTAEIAETHAESELEKYRIVLDRLFKSDFDRLLKQIESENKQGNDNA